MSILPTFRFNLTLLTIICFSFLTSVAELNSRIKYPSYSYFFRLYPSLFDQPNHPGFFTLISSRTYTNFQSSNQKRPINWQLGQSFEIPIPITYDFNIVCGVAAQTTYDAKGVQQHDGRLTVNVNYKTSRESNLALGFGFGFSKIENRGKFDSKQNSFLYQYQTYTNTEEPLSPQIRPNFGVGAHFSHWLYFIGGSINELTPNTIKTVGVSGVYDSQVIPKYMFYCGGAIPFERFFDPKTKLEHFLSRFTVIPFVCLRYHSALRSEFGLKFTNLTTGYDRKTRPKYMVGFVGSLETVGFQGCLVFRNYKISENRTFQFSIETTTQFPLQSLNSGFYAVQSLAFNILIP